MKQKPKVTKYDVTVLRDKTLTFKEIAAQLGVSRSYVQFLYRDGYKETVEKRKPHPAFINMEPWRSQGRERIRHLVRYRDNFTCQGCLVKWVAGERHFDVHHLNGMCGKKSHGYDKKSEMSGLITLCHTCHFNRHDYNHSKERNIRAFDRRKVIYTLLKDGTLSIAQIAKQLEVSRALIYQTGKKVYPEYFI